MGENPDRLMNQSQDVNLPEMKRVKDIIFYNLYFRTVLESFFPKILLKKKQSYKQTVALIYAFKCLLTINL